MQRYNGYIIGPGVKKMRLERGLTIEEVSELTELSVSSIKQIEQGGRNMSMNTLYLFMQVYEVDANTILGLYDEPFPKERLSSIYNKINKLPNAIQDYLRETFMYMVQQAYTMNGEIN